VGDKSESVTVGFKYFLGAHMGLVHGPVDSLNRIRVADKVAWVGSVTETGTAIEIEQEELFGGEGGEGGIVGTIRFENGEPTAIQNGYLLTQLGPTNDFSIPAFRGVTCVVLEQPYVSANNPYLKPWAFLMTRTDITTRGAEQWYVEKARIGVLSDSFDPGGWERVFVSGDLSGAVTIEDEVGNPLVYRIVDATVSGATIAGRVFPKVVGQLELDGCFSLESIQFQDDTQDYHDFTDEGVYLGVRQGPPAYIRQVAESSYAALSGSLAYEHCGILSGTHVYMLAGRTPAAGITLTVGGACVLPDLTTRIDQNLRQDWELIQVFLSPLTGTMLVVQVDNPTAITSVEWREINASGTVIRQGTAETPYQTSGDISNGNAGGAPGWFDSGSNYFAFVRSSAFISVWVIGDDNVARLEATDLRLSDLNNIYPTLWITGDSTKKLIHAFTGYPSGLGDDHYYNRFEVEVVEATTSCPDMNPAHIIRECLTDKEWGMGYADADIDDAAFTAAADTLYTEEMGISILWQRENTIEAFVQDIVRHIDAALYVDRRTGKFVLS